MMRSVTLGTNALTVRNLNACDCLKFNGTQIQSIRWKRKPIWLPTAKSKMFRIPQHAPMPEDEKIELQRLTQNYKTLSNSVLKYFHKKYNETVKTLETHVVEKNMKKDFEICSYLNDLWNKQVAAARKERLANERVNRMEEIAMKLKEKEERDLQIQKRVDAEIRKAKEESSTFITPKNIDKSIDDALETIVDHNAAIDLNGNFYKDEPKISVSLNATN